MGQKHRRKLPSNRVQDELENQEQNRARRKTLNQLEARIRQEQETPESRAYSGLALGLASRRTLAGMVGGLAGVFVDLADESRSVIDLTNAKENEMSEPRKETTINAIVTGFAPDDRPTHVLDPDTKSILKINEVPQTGCADAANT
jgi:hypothetical protein